ncbi:hypothetical protein JOE40_003821 [Arthrobacter sp. PvP102]|nr:MULTISPECIES: hypothetical protein [unclassified Arthrobacter]MBP1234178.1 hypothetical protein [Arthrobacter sp. PvP103]MBP1239312.1 hypothetical protein [Arthrobacter sp. PvP102]
MTTRTRALRNLAGYAAGFVPSVLIGVIAMLAVALVFRGHDAQLNSGSVS